MEKVEPRKSEEKKIGEKKCLFFSKKTSIESRFCKLTKGMQMTGINDLPVFGKLLGCGAWCTSFGTQ